MNARRAAAPGGLSTSDIDAIRATLESGRKPKVMFTEAAGQIAGEVGQVIRLADPGQSDEWLVVRFGRDELPFAPGDLTLAARGRSSRRANGSSPPAPARTAGPAAAAAPAPPSTGKETAGKETAGKETAKMAPTRKAPAEAPTSNPAVPDPAPVAEERPRPAKRAGRKARPSKPKVPAAMTVTLAYEDGEWTVAAHQGSKTLAKPYVVRAADALKMVSMLDVPGVHDAVEAIVTAELTEAAQRAERLRNELAEVEARLAELRDAT